ncbi:MAG TPA: hypothetical protein VK790_09340 [Solirubrobacteraceae bacterium]|jgi:hypothetical protein|nr:hypothetical protein [Solirubrobacteraceae bacterium]
MADGDAKQVRASCEVSARVAETSGDALEQEGTTEEIDRAVAGISADHEFTDTAAALAAADQT